MENPWSLSLQPYLGSTLALLHQQIDLRWIVTQP